MQAIRRVIFTLSEVSEKEGLRLAEVMKLGSGGHVCSPGHPLYKLWKFFDGGQERGQFDPERPWELDEEQWTELHAAVSLYMRDANVAALDEVDVEIVRALLFQIPRKR